MTKTLENLCMPCFTSRECYSMETVNSLQNVLNTTVKLCKKGCCCGFLAYSRFSYIRRSFRSKTAS